MTEPLQVESGKVSVLCPGCWRPIWVPADQCFLNPAGEWEVPDECVKPCPRCGWKVEPEAQPRVLSFADHWQAKKDERFRPNLTTELHD